MYPKATLQTKNIKLRMRSKRPSSLNQEEQKGNNSSMVKSLSGSQEKMYSTNYSVNIMHRRGVKHKL